MLNDYFISLLVVKLKEAINKLKFTLRFLKHSKCEERSNQILLDLQMDFKMCLWLLHQLRLLETTLNLMKAQGQAIYIIIMTYLKLILSQHNKTLFSRHKWTSFSCLNSHLNNSISRTTLLLKCKCLKIIKCFSKCLKCWIWITAKCSKTTISNKLIITIWWCNKTKSSILTKVSIQIWSLNTTKT